MISLSKLLFHKRRNEMKIPQRRSLFRLLTFAALPRCLSCRAVRWHVCHCATRKLIFSTNPFNLIVALAGREGFSLWGNCLFAWRCLKATVIPTIPQLFSSISKVSFIQVCIRLPVANFITDERRWRLDRWSAYKLDTIFWK